MNDGGGSDQSSQIDVLSVGDIVTDAFIKLLDDQAFTYENEQGDWLAMHFGAKLPFDHAQIIEGVGNAANAAVSFSRLGLKSALVANVGDDNFGRDMIAAQQKNGVDVRFIHINVGKPSHYHYVLWYKEDRTILVNSVQYEYHWPHPRPTEIPKWVYFSSVGKYALEYHDQIADWLEQNPAVKFAFQPGTFQMETGVERLTRLYKRSDILLFNREEAASVTNGNHEDIAGLLAALHGLGAKIAVITDGPDGAYASDGANKFKMPAYPDPGPPVERTGAGDAFSSAFVAAIAHGANIEGALQWAPINSMNVVQHVGAQEGLLDDKQMGEFLQQAPEWYKPERI